MMAGPELPELLAVELLEVLDVEVAVEVAVEEEVAVEPQWLLTVAGPELLELLVVPHVGVGTVLESLSSLSNGQ